MNLSPPPRSDKDLIGHSWQDWFFKLWKEVQGMNDYNLAAIGAGAVSGKTPFYIYGKNSDVDNALETVWAAGGNYVFPTTPIQMQVVSSSANDDGAPAGTGVQIVDIHYLDTNYAEQYTTVILNGTTAVNTTPTNILRVNAFYTATVGTGGVAAGNISLQSVGGATTYAYIPAGENNSPQAVYTVPANKTAYVTWWDVSSGVDTGNHYTQFSFVCDVTMEGTRNAGVMIEHDMLGCLNGSAHAEANLPFGIPEKSDIIIKAKSDAAAANAITTTHFHGWLQ